MGSVASDTLTYLQQKMKSVKMCLMPSRSLNFHLTRRYVNLRQTSEVPRVDQLRASVNVLVLTQHALLSAGRQGDWSLQWSVQDLRYLWRHPQDGECGVFLDSHSGFFFFGVLNQKCEIGLSNQFSTILTLRCF